MTPNPVTVAEPRTPSNTGVVTTPKPKKKWRSQLSNDKRKRKWQKRLFKLRNRKNSLLNQLEHQLDDRLPGSAKKFRASDNTEDRLDDLRAELDSRRKDKRRLKARLDISSREEPYDDDNVSQQSSPKMSDMDDIHSEAVRPKNRLFMLCNTCTHIL